MTGLTASTDFPLVNPVDSTLSFSEAFISNSCYALKCLKLVEGQSNGLQVKLGAKGKMVQFVLDR